MSDYTDIKLHLEKAKSNVLNALRLSETMENTVGVLDDYQTLISDLEHIVEIIDKCEVDSEYVTDVFEMATK